MDPTSLAIEKVWKVLLHLQQERDLGKHYAFFVPFFRLPLQRSRWIGGLPTVLVYAIGEFLVPRERTLDRHSMYLLVDIVNEGWMWRMQTESSRQQHYRDVLADRKRFTRERFTVLAKRYPEAIPSVLRYFKLHGPTLETLRVDPCRLKAVHLKQAQKWPTITWLPHPRRLPFPPPVKSWWEVCKVM